MRVQVLVSVGPGPGHSGSDGVNGEAPPPGGMVPGWLTRCAAAEAVAVSAPARCRGDRVGLRNGGVHVLRPAVGRGRPEEPPAADDAAGRRPGKSARSPSASGGGGVGVGGRGARRGRGPAAGLPAAPAGPRVRCGVGAGRGGCEPGVRAGARAAPLRCSPRPQKARPGASAARLASTPGAWQGSSRGAPGSSWPRPDASVPLLGKRGCPSSVLSCPGSCRCGRRTLEH